MLKERPEIISPENIELSSEKEPNKENESRYSKNVEASLGRILGPETLNSGIKKEAGEYITKEQDETTLEFMRKLFVDNKQTLKEEGFWVENAGDSFIVKACREKLNWKDSLETDDKYKKYKDDFEHFDYLGRNFNKENVPEDAKFLMVNKLYKTISEKEKEMGEKGKNVQAEAEIKKLYTLAENISNDISGLNIRKEAEKEVVLPNKEDFVSSDIIESEEKKMREGMNEKNEPVEKSTEDVLHEYFGYEVKKIDKGFWKNEEMVISARDENGDLKKIKSFEMGWWSSKVKDKKKYEDFIKGKLQEEIKKEIEVFYGKEVEKRSFNVEKNIREKIKEISSSPEKAIGGIEAYFEKINQKDIDKEKEEIEKRKANLAKKSKEAKKKESESNESWNNLSRGAQKLVNGMELSEDFDESLEDIRDVLEEAGYGTVKEEELIKDKWFQKSIVGRYGEVFKNKDKDRKAWNGWLTQFLLAIINSFNKK
jgi:hypothetical protein